MKKLLILTICFAAISLSGCSDSSSVSKDELKMPQTTTNLRRADYNKSLTRDTQKESKDFTYINVDIRPKFVLHIDADGNISEFESLNDDADILSEQTKELWSGKPYSEAFSSIIEQCIIDGYISDNNPAVKVEVTGKSSDSVLRDVSDILDYSTSIHGLSVDIQLNDVD